MDGSTKPNHDGHMIVISDAVVRGACSVGAYFKCGIADQSHNNNTHTYVHCVSKKNKTPNSCP